MFIVWVGLTKMRHICFNEISDETFIYHHKQPAKEKDLCGRRVNCFILARFISTCIQYVGRTRQVMLLCFTSEMAPATVPEHTAYTRPVWVDQSCSKNGAQQGGFI